MYHIMIVDDDVRVLNAIRRALLHPNPNTYALETFASPATALARAKVADFDLIIADYRMPGMSGIKFLEYFRRLQPLSCRILLSGHADSTMLRDAINCAHAAYFIAKPWDGETLRVTITHGLLETELRRRIHKIEIMGRDERIANTPRDKTAHHHHLWR